MQESPNLPELSLKSIYRKFEDSSNSLNSTSSINFSPIQKPKSRQDSIDSIRSINSPKIRSKGISLVSNGSPGNKSKFQPAKKNKSYKQTLTQYTFNQSKFNNQQLDIHPSKKPEQELQSQVQRYTTLQNSPLYNDLAPNVEKPQYQQEIEWQEKLKNVYQSILPYMKSLESQINDYILNDQPFREQLTSYGVPIEQLGFHFIRYMEFCLGNESINPKSLEFFRISKSIYKQLYKKVGNILQDHNCQDTESILSLLNENVNLILPQNLLQYLGSNEQIPKIFHKILYDLNTQQDFYLQDYLQKNYDISDQEVLQLVKSIFGKQKDYLKMLMSKLKNKASFTYPEIFITKFIIWESLGNLKYNPRIINEIMEILESFRYAIWEKKGKLIEEIQPIFAKQLSEKLLVNKQNREEVKQFGYQLIKHLFLDPNIQQACQLLQNLFPNTTAEYILQDFFIQVETIWKVNKFDKLLIRDFKIKLRKCSYLMGLQERPLNTDESKMLIEEMSNCINKEQQQIGGDLLMPHFLDVVSYIINFYYSSKDSISLFDILGGVRALNFSKQIGQNIYHMLQATFESFKLDPKKQKICLDLFKEEIHLIEEVQTAQHPII